MLSQNIAIVHKRNCFFLVIFFFFKPNDTTYTRYKNNSHFVHKKTNNRTMSIELVTSQ